MQAGEVMPVHATSGGKAILAAISPPQRNLLLSKLKLSKVTPRTITSRAVLKSEIEEIERTGIAYSRGEFEEGVLGISVAVLRPDGSPEGSLSVVLPTPRDKASHRAIVVDALLAAKERLETEFRQFIKPAASR
jgi:DNA-binding IclR family transcriptional regulator